MYSSLMSIDSANCMSSVLNPLFGKQSISKLPSEPDTLNLRVTAELLRAAGSLWLFTMECTTRRLLLQQ